VTCVCIRPITCLLYSAIFFATTTPPTPNKHVPMLASCCIGAGRVDPQLGPASTASGGPLAGADSASAIGIRPRRPAIGAELSDSTLISSGALAVERRESLGARFCGAVLDHSFAPRPCASSHRPYIVCYSPGAVAFFSFSGLEAVTTRLSLASAAVAADPCRLMPRKKSKRGAHLAKANVNPRKDRQQG
jgi:hypothetical protein